MKTKKNWFGINIKEKIAIRGVKILLAEDTIIILIKDVSNSSDYVDFYSTLIYFLKYENQIKIGFGLFLNPNSDLVRKRVIKNYLKNINLINMLSLLEGDNIEAYYENRHITDELLGLELRFDKDWSTPTKEKVLTGIMKEIGYQRDQLFEKTV